jgi:hypothetical protein
VTALQGLARNPALPAALLERLIALNDTWLDRVLSGRDDLTAAQAEVLAARSTQVMVELDCRIEQPASAYEEALQQACDPAASPAVVAELVRHPTPSIRHVVARRTDLPPWACEHLAKDPAVRHRIAANPAAPEAVLRDLAAKADRETRRVLVQNPSIPLDLLISLVALTGRSPVPRVAVASEAELRALASSSTPRVRMLAAHRHDLPADVLALLLADPAPDVVAVVATNPALTAAQLEDLVARHGPRLSARVAQNPNCTPELLHLLARDRRAPGEACREIVKHPNTSAETLPLCLRDREARRLAAGRPDLPVETLVELVADPYAGETAAANPSLPVHVMEGMLNSTT